MLRVCLTGATGFIGKNLLKVLESREDIHVTALSRKISPQMDGAQKGNVTWRRCNGFSLVDVEKVMEGCDVLIYLIHSMVPATALSQGHFADFDLYLADNFSRGAKRNGIKKIIYLSGLIPESTKLSDHLESRKEVEAVLSQYGNDLTVLRAGLIVGRNGSSFRILEKLIKRLPVLICPSWTLTKSQPIDVEDVMASINYCIDNMKSLEAVYDIGGPDIITYRGMLEKTAKVLGKKRHIVNVPVFSPELSKLWVSKVTTTSHQLVYPLIESLKHTMVANPEKKLIIPDHEYIPFEDSLRRGINPESEGFVRSIINYNGNINFRWLENVSSIQRLKLKHVVSAENVAQAYFEWLPRFLRPFIQVTLQGDKVYFCFLKVLTLLVLEKCVERSYDGRVFYYIRGGILARETSLNGRLEFRIIDSTNIVLVALQDFRPSLPWFIYKYTQALFHLFVMKSFSTYLYRFKRKV